MSIVTRKMKAGVSYAQFGCGSHYSRGSSICSNNLTISEKKITAALLAALTDTLGHPDIVARFVDQAQRRIAQMSRVAGSSDVERHIRDSERRVANLTETLAKLGWSDAIGAKLQAEEEQLGRLKSDRAAAKDQAPRTLPHPTRIAADFKNLMGILKADPVHGRQILSRFVAPLVMTPESKGSDRSYRATGAFDLSFWFEKESCAGSLRGLEHAISEAFERSLAA